MPDQRVKQRTEELLQAGGKGSAHCAGFGPCAAWGNPIVLLHIGSAEVAKLSNRLRTAGSRQTPATDRGTDQVDRLRGARQELAKEVAVDRAQDQGLGAPGCCRNGGNLLRAQPFPAQATLRSRTGEYTQTGGR